MTIKSIKLGDIVSLKSHPFFENITNIVLSGEPTLFPPLMIVIERLFHKAESSLVKNDISRAVKEYKCIWYSHKTHQFEESWFSGTLIKSIQELPNILCDEISEGDLVGLKTIYSELGKKKSTLSYDEGNVDSNVKKTNISSLLSFLSPIMHINQIAKNNALKKSNPNVEVCEDVVKCKWFNPKSDKFSEFFLPLCAVQLVEIVDTVLLAKIHSAIKRKRYFIIKRKEDKTLVKPNSIVYRSGKYLLKSMDYLLNDWVELEITPEIKFITRKFPFISKAPVFNFSKNFLPVNSVKEAIEKAKKDRLYIRIEYKNRNDKFSTRTIKDYKMENVREDNKKVTYLTGHCMTKNDERSFRMDRIQQVQVLALSFPKRK